MMFDSPLLKSATLCMLFCSATLLMQGCQSTIDDIATQIHGSSAGDGYTYGTGPNKTRPYPQTSPVNINNVGGAKPKYEDLSRGGNKDYTVLGQNYMVWTNCTSYQEVGTASWYGPGFHGNKTSNGEVYDQKGYSAAHKNLPLPSYLKVSNLENGKAVVVRVNDRGPFHGSRIIDLSEGAAKAIDMTGKGTAKVKIELINIRGDSNVTTEGGSGQGTGSLGGILAGDKGAIAGAVIGAVVNKTGANETIQNIKNIHELVETIESGKTPSVETVRNAAGSMADIADNLNKAATAQSLANQKQNATQTSNAVITTTTTTSTTYSNPNTNQVISSKVVKETTNAQAPTIVSNATIDYVSPAAQDISKLVSGQPYVQFFTSSSQWRASNIQAKVQKQTPLPVIVVAEDNLYRVMVGPVSANELMTIVEYFKQLGYADAFVKHIK